MTHNPHQPTILVTGGHLTPAVATIDALQSTHPDWKIVFVGRTTSIEGSGVASEEKRIIEAKGISFVPINAGRMKRDGGWLGLVALLKVPIGFSQALGILARTKPQVVVSFGGYVALPIVYAAWILRIPVVTHEQTTSPGLANRAIARLATKICVSFAQTQGALPGSIVTGLPLRASIFTPPNIAPFSIDKKLPVLFITGGSTGSVSVNRVLYKILPRLLDRFTVIHQVGSLTIDQARSVKEELEAHHRARYVPVPYVDESAYSWVVHNAHIVLGRAGANTVMELAALAKVAIFIPLPWAASNEQYTNAQVLERAGTAVIVPQDSCTPETVLAAIDDVDARMRDMKKAAVTFSKTIPTDAAQKLVVVIESIVS
jgi:UDP-N-acetylglucosamine--N-acetylmuramyl-(pentapeptide) pyrophosphoryl-undecaprenol N-acetylglucosamine transferase